MALRAGEVLVVDGRRTPARRRWLLTLAGRMRLAAGRAKIDRARAAGAGGEVRGRTAVIDCADWSRAPDRTRLRGGLRAGARCGSSTRAPVILVDHADVLSAVDDRAALASLVDETTGSDHGLVITARDRELVDDLIRLPTGT